jgi:hypothetical protein
MGQLVGSVCCWPAKDGINTLGVKYRVNPGVQLVRVRSQHLSMIGFRNPVEASLKQPEQRLSLSLSFTFSSSLFAFLRQDRHHRLPLLIRRPGQRPLDRPPVDRIIRRGNRVKHMFSQFRTII